MDAPPGNRGVWWPRSDFFFACLSLTLTTSDLMRTPYLMFRNGGGVIYMISYLTGLVLFAYPLMFMEISLGQFASGGLLTIFNCCPLFKGVGYAALVMIAFFLMYYAVMIGYPLHYLLVTIITKDTYPWLTCGNVWNTQHCLGPTRVTELSAAEGTMMNNVTYSDLLQVRTSPSLEYFEQRFLQQSEGVTDIGGVNWELLLALMVVWTLSFFSLMFGHYSLGKVAFFTSLVPFGLIVALTVRGCILPGARYGLMYMFYPETQWHGFAGLREYRRLRDAYVSVLYQFGPMMGAYAMLGSYNKKTYNFYRDSILVVVISVLFPLVCTVMVGSYVGYFAHINNKDIHEYMTSGPGLLYIVMPEILASLPRSKIWLSLFFVAIFLLSFGTQIILLEGVVTAIADEFFPSHLSKRARMVFRSIGAFILCLVLFLSGIAFVTQGGVYYLTLFDWYVMPWTTPFLWILSCIAVTWIYGMVNYSYDVEVMLGFKPNYLILGGLIVMVPLGSMFLVSMSILEYVPVVFYDNYQFPPWTIIIGWGLVGIALFMIPLLFCVQIFKVCCCSTAEQSASGGCRARCARIFDASPLWKKMKIQTTFQPLAQITADQLQSSKKSNVYPVLDESQA